MDETVQNALGKLILRLAIGGLVLLHGWHKVVNGIAGIEGMLTGAGLPGLIGPLVYVGEVLGPVLLILGFYARVGAALIVVNMLFALGLAHADELWQLTKQGGWAIELQAAYLFGALALVFLGPGRWAVNQR